MGVTRRDEVRAPSLSVSDFTCDKRIALDDLRAASAVDVRERSARRKMLAERCMTGVFMALSALMRLLSSCCAPALA